MTPFPSAFAASARTRVVRRVASAAKKIHDHFGTGAQDIEWGMIGERLYIFQARPYLDAVKPFEQAAGN